MQDRPQRWAWTHRYAVPMFVFSLAAVVLSGAGLVAVMVFVEGAGQSGDADQGGGDQGGSLGGGEVVDASCVVGDWRVTGYTEDGALGSARMVEGEPVFQFWAEGTGLADFSEVKMEVESVVGTATGDITGQITYQYEVSGQTLEFVDQQSNATITSDHEVADLLGPGQFTLPTGPLDSRCDGDVLTFTDGEQTFELQRVG